MNRFRGPAAGIALALMTLGLVGCGGIRGSHSVSPASFFLPGLIKNDTPPPTPPGTATPLVHPAVESTVSS